jgi:hypothetical protein
LITLDLAARFVNNRNSREFFVLEVGLEQAGTGLERAGTGLVRAGIDPERVGTGRESTHAERVQP